MEKRPPRTQVSWGFVYIVC